MKAWVRVLLVIHLVMAVVAFCLGLMLFERREILKGRTQSLETAIVALGTTLQREAPVSAQADTYPERDTGPLAWDGGPRQPQTGFWADYDAGLESRPGDTWALQNRRLQLAQYYQLDPVTMKPKRDPLTGERLTTGKGTMRDLLARVQRSAVAQRDVLDRTRDALIATRSELVDTIVDANERKADLRSALGSIRDRDLRLDDQGRELVARSQTISERDLEISGLRNETLDLQTRLDHRNERIADLENDVTILEKLIATGPGPGGTGFAPADSIERGVLGTVTGVSTNWGFVTVAFEPRFASQYAQLKDRTGRVRQLNVMITRSGAQHRQVVGKARLNWVHPDDDVGVADVLMHVAHAQPGDQLVY